MSPHACLLQRLLQESRSCTSLPGSRIPAGVVPDPCKDKFAVWGVQGGPQQGCGLASWLLGADRCPQPARQTHG